MSNRSIEFRRIVVSTASFALLLISWTMLLLGSIVVVVGVLWVAIAPKNENSNNILLIGLVVGLLYLLIGSLFRWMARGISNGRRGRIAFSAIFAIALAIVSYYALRNMTNVGQQLQIALWGLSFLFGGSALIWLLFPRGQQNET